MIKNPCYYDLIHAILISMMCDKTIDPLLYRKKTIRLRAVLKKIKSLERFPPSSTSGSKRKERPMSSVGLLDEHVPKSQAPPNSGTQNHSTQVQSTLRKGTQTHGTQTQSARRCT